MFAGFSHQRAFGRSSPIQQPEVYEFRHDLNILDYGTHTAFIHVVEEIGNYDPDLYLHHLRCWDEYTQLRISLLLHQSSELSLNVMTSLVLPDWPITVHDIKEILADGLVPEMIEDFENAGDSTLGIMHFKYGLEKFTDYHSISQFLNDPLRLGDLHVDGNRFAGLTIRFSTKYLLKYAAPEETTTRRSVLATEDSPNRCQTALLYLPLCISKSSPSKELTTLLAKLELHSTSYNGDPVTKEKVLEAISAYTSRPTIPEIPEVVIDNSIVFTHQKPDNSAALSPRKPDKPKGGRFKKLLRFHH